MVDGTFYQSTGEATRHQELLIMQRAGLISNLRHNKFTYNLEVNGVLITTYRPDFIYHNNETGLEVVEDFKGVRTEEFKIKSKLMLAIYGIKVLETTSK
jgi:hypothetical protein